MPSKIEVLARELSITEEEYEFFERRLKGDGAGRSGFNQPSRCGLRSGQIGFGQMPCRGAQRRLRFRRTAHAHQRRRFVLYERQMRGIMHGDIVTVRPAGIDRRGRREGTVLDIVERAQKQWSAVSIWIEAWRFWKRKTNA